MKCNICENLEDGDTLYVSSDWDGGIGFDYIRDIKYCPVCGRKLRAEQTESMKTTDYCDICKRDMCEDCIADATNPYCVPSHYEINYEPKDEPQMEDLQDWKDRMWAEAIVTEPITEDCSMISCLKCEHNEHCHYLVKDIPWPDCPWKRRYEYNRLCSIINGQ